MKLNKWISALVLALALCLMASVALAADVYNYDDFYNAVYDGATEINIKADFEVNNTENDHKYYLKLPAGCTVNGGNHTIKLISLLNGSNGSSMFTTLGNCTIKNLTFDATNLVNGRAAFDLRAGDTIEGVTIIGANKLQHGATADWADGEVTVKNCNISDVTGSGIYVEDERATPIMNVTNSTFTNCLYATMLFGDGGTFSNNTVTDSRVNMVGTSATVTGNTFNGKSRIKFYEENGAKDFSGNYINDESYIVNEDAAKNTDLSNNIYENIYTALASDTISDAAKADAIAAHIARNQPKGSTPQTGDNANIALWIALMAISAISFVALGRKSRFN